MTQEKINAAFSKIAGYAGVKADAMEIVDMMVNDEKYISSGAHIPKGYLLYGDPGMGKTLMVRAMAEASECPLFEISESKAIARGIEVEELIVNTFTEAHEVGKCFVLIDEIDKLAGYQARLYDVTENLARQKILMQALDEIKPSEEIIVVATGNRLELLQEAFLRTGRIDRMIRFRRPGESDRLAIFKHYTSHIKLGDDVDLVSIMRDIKGCTCSDIECIANEAIINSVKRRSQTINNVDIITAATRVQNRDIQNEIDGDPESVKMIAMHEAGHAFMCLYNDIHVVSATIYPHGRSSGSVKQRVNDNLLTKQDYLNKIQVGLAGRLAVLVLTGKETDGAAGDLEMVKDIFNDMCINGMMGYDYYPWQAPSEGFNDQCYNSAAVCKKFAEVVKAQDEIVREVMGSHRACLQRLADVLYEKKQLDYNELCAVYAEGNGECSHI